MHGAPTFWPLNVCPLFRGRSETPTPSQEHVVFGFLELIYVILRGHFPIRFSKVCVETLHTFSLGSYVFKVGNYSETYILSTLPSKYKYEHYIILI